MIIVAFLWKPSFVDLYFLHTDINSLLLLSFDGKADMCNMETKTHNQTV